MSSIDQVYCSAVVGESYSKTLFVTEIYGGHNQSLSTGNIERVRWT